LKLCGRKGQISSLYQLRRRYLVGYPNRCEKRKEAADYEGFLWKRNCSFLYAPLRRNIHHRFTLLQYCSYQNEYSAIHRTSWDPGSCLYTLYGGCELGRVHANRPESAF